MRNRTPLRVRGTLFRRTGALPDEASSSYIELFHAPKGVFSVVGERRDQYGNTFVHGISTDGRQTEVAIQPELFTEPWYVRVNTK